MLIQIVEKRSEIGIRVVFSGAYLAKVATLYLRLGFVQILTCKVVKSATD